MEREEEGELRVRGRRGEGEEGRGGGGERGKNEEGGQGGEEKGERRGKNMSLFVYEQSNSKFL